MRNYLKTMAAWKQLLLFIGMAIGILLIFSFIGTMVLSGITGIPLLQIADESKWDFSNPRLIDFLLGMQFIQFLGLFLIPSLLFGYLSAPHPLHHLGFKKADNGVFYLLGLLLLLVSFPLVEQIGVWNRMIQFPPSMAKWIREKEDSAARIIEFMLSKHSVKALLMNIIFIAGLAAFGEELFFRGVLQRIFIRMFKNPWAGIIITAFLFSAIHMQFYGFLPRFLLGIFLGLIYWYSGSLWPAILAHFIYDASLITLAYFHPEMIKEESTGVLSNYQLIIPAIISLIFTLAIVRLMKKKSTISYEKIYADDYKPPDPFEFE